MLIICVYLSDYLFIKTLFGTLSVLCILQMFFLLGMFCFWGCLGFGEVMLSPFLPVPVRVLELESSGADPESSGAVDLETKRGISTPERK